jgi:hypothetical protein
MQVGERKYRIGNDFLEIYCFRSIPGLELALADKMAENGGVPFKGLGAFDVISFSSSKDISTHGLANLPTASVNTSIIPCFSFVPEAGTSSKEILSVLRSHSCVALTFVKLKSVPEKDYGDWKVQLIRKLTQFGHRSTERRTRYVLGTVGWYELVIITCADDPSSVTRYAVQLGLECQDAVAKTYSVVCIGHNELKLLSGEGSPTTLAKSFDESIPREINASIVFSISPLSMRTAHRYWSERKYIVSDLLGREDMQVTLSGEITWRRLLEDLLWFRRELGSQLLYTQLRLARETPFEAGNSDGCVVTGKQRQGTHDVKQGPISVLHVPPPSWSDEAKSAMTDYLGSSTTEELISIVEHLFSLQRNHVEGLAFDDMLPYASSINERFCHKEGGAASATRQPLSAHGITATELIKQGIQLRLHGIHGTMGELSLQMPPLRSGVHRILLSIEAFVQRVASRLCIDWAGFAIASARGFFSSVEIINVPYSSLFSPTDWWGIYHEIGHVFIVGMEDEGFLTKDTDVVKSFVTKTKGDWNRIDELQEIAAEVIGFDLGFYGDFDLFARRLWTYLKDALRATRLRGDEPDALADERRVTAYLIRSFSVQLYNDHIRSDKDLCIFENRDMMYRKFYSHIQWIYKDVLKIKMARSSMCFIAAKLTTLAMDMKDILVHIRLYLYGNGDEQNRWPLPEKHEINKKRGQEKTNTGHVVDAILKGEVWTGKVNYPEAVLYWLMKEEMSGSKKLRKKLTATQEIAAILTFWNLYRVRLSQSRLIEGAIEVTS